VITAVDTNILLDVFGANPKFVGVSSSALRRCWQEGALVASDVVWAETAAVFADFRQFIDEMEGLSISFSPTTQTAALRAAEFWRSYRAVGGSRVRIAADFLIGAHALVTADRLLTRDRGFYRQYFAGLRVLDPSAAAKRR
jgi:predicted nucleic acid-binding protein